MPGLQTNAGSGRLRSLDFFRGFVMFLLVAEGTELYHHLLQWTTPGTLGWKIVEQFHHHPWNGLRFWDLIQPFFMFIVGVAMAFSLEKRWKSSASATSTFLHILKRCLLLLALGVMLHCGYNRKLVWELWNVLSQLSVTIMIAYLIFKWPLKYQLVLSFALLALTEIAYRSFSIPGYEMAFVKGHNFGSWMDMVLMGKINSGGWVAINCIPTAAHTIWGVVAGKLLMSQRKDMYKVFILAGAGLLGLIIGYTMDWTGLTPIIKRICTSSFVIASGGWCLVTLAFSYWLIDIKGWRRGTLFVIIVGMNPIFIYIFSNTVGGQWVNDFVGIFTLGALGAIGLTGEAALTLNALAVLALEWYLCYWLYKKQIFIKI